MGNNLIDLYYNFLSGFTSSANKFIAKTDQVYHVKYADEQRLINHLLGIELLGVIPDVADQATFGCIDIDLGTKAEKEDKDPKELLASVLDAASKISLHLETLGIHPIVEISKSGIGAHVWVLFNEPLPRSSIQTFLLNAIGAATEHEAKSVNGFIEVFPKGNKGGTGVWLPLFGSFLDKETLNKKPIKEKTSVLIDSEGKVDNNRYLRQLKNIKTTNQAALTKAFQNINLPPCFQAASASWTKGCRDAYACGMAGIAKKHLGLTVDQAVELITDIAKNANDEEVLLRSQAVENTYRVEKVSGCGIMQGKNDSITIPKSVCSTNCKIYQQNKSLEELREKGRFTPYLFAQILLERFSILSDGERGVIWIYDEITSIWNPEGEQKLKAFMETDPDFLPVMRRNTPNINAIIDSIRRSTYIHVYNIENGTNTADVNAFPESNPALIPFKNGVFNLDLDTFGPYKAEYFIRTKIPWDYRENATCHNLDKLFKGFVRPEDIVSLYELLAYCLWRDNTRAQLMFILKGSGSNGKSLFMEILAKFVGQHNMSAQSLDNIMRNNFAISCLRDKLVNDGQELPVSQTITRPEILKTLSVGDYVQSDIKYKTPIVFRNYAKLIFYGNYLPKTTDTSKGFYRRLFILDFPFSYDKKVRNEEDTKNLFKAFRDAEFEGLAYKIVQVLKKLKANDFRFTKHPDWQEVQKVYEQESQPLFRFIHEFCDIDHEEKSCIAKFDFKDRLSGWISKKGTSNPYKSDSLIKSEMQTLDLEEGKRAFMKGGEAHRYNAWIGIKWKEGTSGSYKSVNEADLAEENKGDDEMQLGMFNELPEQPVIEMQMEQRVGSDEPETFAVALEKQKPSTEGVSVDDFGLVDDIDSLVVWLKDQPTVYLDIETYSETGSKEDNLDPINNKVRVITLGNPTEAYMVDVCQHAHQEVKDLVMLLKNKRVVGHNLKFDLSTLAYKYGIELLPKEVFCTMLASKIIRRSQTSDRGGNSLQDITERYLGIKMDKTQQVSNWGYTTLGAKREKLRGLAKNSLNAHFVQKNLNAVVTLNAEQIEYAKKDVRYLPYLMDMLVSEIHKISIKSSKNVSFAGSRDFITNLEMEFLPNIIKMEYAGVPVNIEGLTELKDKYTKEYEALYSEITSKYGIENPNSPPQLLKLLQDNNVQITSYNAELKKDVTELISSTGKEILEKIDTDSYPVVKDILKLRSALKLKGMLEGYLKVYPDKRLHPVYNQILETGRMSCKSPNVQQVPKSFKKKFYKAPEGKSLISIDYPAIELRILAAFLYKNYNDETMINNFKAGIDPHIATASLVYKKPISEIAKDSAERQSAKAVNFGLSYGMGGVRFKNYATGYGLDITVDEAAEFKVKYKDAYPGLKAWHADYGRKLKESKNSFQVQSLAGRLLVASKYTDVLNYPIQGTGGDITKYAINIFYALLAEFPELESVTNVINVVHDDIIVLTDKEHEKQVGELLASAMEQSANFILKYFDTEVEID